MWFTNGTENTGHLFIMRWRITIHDSCPAQVRHKALSLGEVLDGDRMAESLYNIRFRENIERQTLCQMTLTEKEVNQPSVPSDKTTIYRYYDDYYYFWLLI